jgi:hypothetical protein
MVRSRMDTLREVDNPRQRAGEPPRRWFSAEHLDLIVWSDAAGRPNGFQLCYGKPRGEHALTWTVDAGFTHAGVDDGSDVGVGHKASPILVPDGAVDVRRLEREFREASSGLPPDVVTLVVEKLAGYPERGA